MPPPLSPVLAVLSALYREDPQHSVPALLALLALWQEHPRRLTQAELAASSGVKTAALSRAVRRLGEHVHPRSGRPMFLVSSSFPADSGKLQYGLSSAGVALCRVLAGAAEAGSHRGADAPES
jgi:hypothetical protein